MFRCLLARCLVIGLLLLVIPSSGCISIPSLNPIHYAREALNVEAPLPKEHSADKTPAAVLVAKPTTPEVHQVRAQKETKKNDELIPLEVKQSDFKSQPMPIDLVTVLRLIDDRSPVVNFARARLAQAQSREDQADVLWLPNLSVGTAYNRFDGQTQNQRGEVFETNRGNLFGGGGAALNLDISDALFEPLIAKRVTQAEMYTTEATRRDAQLNAVMAYIDLVQAHAFKSVAEDSVARAQKMLKYAKDADAAGLARTASDINRAVTELHLREAESEELNARIGSTSAQLAQMLALTSAVELQPLDLQLAPITLIDANQTPDELLAIAVANRPDLAAHREHLLASIKRLRKQEFSPYIPKVAIADQVGRFGGGFNDDLTNFGSRHVLSSSLFWEVRNMGFGNRAQIREQQALNVQQQQRLIELESRITAEVTDTYRLLQSRKKMLEPARLAVQETLVWYRKALEMSENALEKRGQFDTLEPVRSIQSLHLARMRYISAVLEHNKAQYRLFAVLGYPVNLSKPD